MYTTAPSGGSTTEEQSDDLTEVRIIGIGNRARYTVEFSGSLEDAESMDSHERIHDDGKSADGIVQGDWDAFYGTGSVSVTHDGPDGDTPTGPFEVEIDGERGTVTEGSTYPNSGIWDLVPGLLPGIGPLNSSQTTAAGILVGLAVLGTVMG